jgi:hypothetical protein
MKPELFNRMVEALEEATAWWEERVASPYRSDVPFTERRNHETPYWYDLANELIAEAKGEQTS